MKGYVTQKGTRWYAVIYEGLDPVTGRELLIDAGVPVKVVSERLGHATAAFTIETYQHVLPSMQTRAIDAVAQLMATPVEASR